MPLSIVCWTCPTLVEFKIDWENFNGYICKKEMNGESSCWPFEKVKKKLAKNFKLARNRQVKSSIKSGKLHFFRLSQKFGRISLLVICIAGQKSDKNIKWEGLFCKKSRRKVLIQHSPTKSLWFVSLNVPVMSRSWKTFSYWLSQQITLCFFCIVNG